jgi:ribosomal protein L4
MKVSVFNMAGKEVNSVDLPASIFEAKINRDLMHQALVRQLANARQGTHKAKGVRKLTGLGPRLTAKKVPAMPGMAAKSAYLCGWWCGTWSTAA